MDKKDLEKIFGSINEKVGKENAGKIADDLGKILTDNETTNKTIESRNTEIETLKKNNEMLITANGNLLQQVGMGEEPKPQNKDEDNKPKFSLRGSFDNKGNFK